MPVSLARGTVRTLDFAVVRGAYTIMLQAESRIPLGRMECMMGMTIGLLEQKECTPQDPLLRAAWVVKDGDQLVSRGASTLMGDAMYRKPYLFKILGHFDAQPSVRYVVEVTFTEDGTPLDVTEPHLIVILAKYQ